MGQGLCGEQHLTVKEPDLIVIPLLKLLSASLADEKIRGQPLCLRPLQRVRALASLAFSSGMMAVAAFSPSMMAR